MAAAIGYVRGMFQWTVKTEGIIAPDERPPAAQSVALGVQHIFAMFGATVLAPVIMGFNPNTAIFFSGIGTLIFFVCVRGRVPSYLGSSFSFIAVVISAEAIAGGPTPNIPVALGGIIACGAVYAVVGLIVMAIGYRWVEFLMPPVVTGAVVAVIGLNLAPAAINYMIGSDAAHPSNFGILVGLLTALVVALVAVYAPGTLRRLPVLVGGVFGYLLYFVLSNVLNLGGTHIDFDAVSKAAIVGWPAFTTPTFDTHAITLIAPVAIVLVAENLGHVKAVAAMTGRDMDPYIGRAFFADGVATMVAGSGGGTGVTTYAENIGVMAVTKIYSSVVFVIAACVAIVLGFSPMFGALVLSIPGPVLGGLAVVLFGLIATTGGRIWVENKVDFTDNKNFITVAVALTLGAGNLAITQGDFSIGGIGTACIGALLIYQILNKFGLGKKADAPAS
ncbi:MAG: solute carrier family 23 protein [Candidatus Limnocylindrales bacterium]|jgi:uracil-xanthine permease